MSKQCGFTPLYILIGVIMLLSLLFTAFSVKVYAGSDKYSLIEQNNSPIKYSAPTNLQSLLLQ
ncbi:hypothetical protein M1563_01375 [Patescibacteria group bacterium]|nr:hypothetical protein [Patescibacteria group bacterium]MCL5410077.1 hypothetical protein [Patescibacteria group bacterium]